MHEYTQNHDTLHRKLFLDRFSWSRGRSHKHRNDSSHKNVPKKSPPNDGRHIIAAITQTYLIRVQTYMCRLLHMIERPRVSPARRVVTSAGLVHLNRGPELCAMRLGCLVSLLHIATFGACHIASTRP